MMLILSPVHLLLAHGFGAVVFQGFPGNSMKAFQQGIVKVVDPGQETKSVGIDPRLFRAFNVTSVPASLCRRFKQARASSASRIVALVASVLQSSGLAPYTRKYSTMRPRLSSTNQRSVEGGPSL
jgi:hypothetical protein